MKKILMKDGMEVSVIYKSEDYRINAIQYVLSIDYQTGTTVTSELREKLGILQIDIQEDTCEGPIIFLAMKGLSADAFIDYIIAEDAKAEGDKCKYSNFPQLLEYLDNNIDRIEI